MNKILLLISMLLGLAVAGTNECAQYATCRECLNITHGDIGGRKNCGWCHFNIIYQNKTTGKRCADIRDDPWHCNDLFDTYKCNMGWKCADIIHGRCEQDKEGDGYGSNTTCQQYCQPHPKDKTYKCNITTWTCDECGENDPSHCTSRREACGDGNKNCQAPPQLKYKCNRTNADAPKCEKCNDGDQGCATHKQACDNCAPTPKLMKCNMKTFQCEQDKSGMIQQACNASCGKITPSNLIGPWRGLMVKEKTKGQFEMGEFDMLFGDSNLTLTWPNKTTMIFDVATSGFAMRLTDKQTGKVYQAISNTIAQLKHTLAMGFATKGAGKEAPDSFGGAMKDTESTAWVMWRCTSPKAQCDFSQTGEELAAELRVGDGDIDACNKYPDCHSCITAKEGDIKCGWCQGGTLNYHDHGQTKFKCGGYKDGTPFKFTCPRAFKTEDCQGYKCDWTNHTCSFAQEGQFPDEATCKQTCVAPKFKKCNHQTKKCDDCTQGSPGCDTDAHCQAICNAQMAKCNHTTGQCKTCDPGTDKDCNMTMGECQGPKCTKDEGKSVCNQTSGKCQLCDPHASGKGCVPTKSCQEQCQPHPPNTTDQYECEWSKTPPTCKKSDAGSYSKKECNDACKAPDFAKCDFHNNKCVGCQVGTDPQCKYTLDYCKAIQAKGECKPQKIQGLYRMIMVQKGFRIAEFDIMFDGAGGAALQMYVTSKTSLGHGKMEVAGQTDDGDQIVHFTEWQGISGSAEAWGVVRLKNGSSQILSVIELAGSKDKIQHLDDGLKSGNAYYVGVGCKDTKNCDFSKAAPAMGLTQPHEYYEFLEPAIIQ